MTYDLNYNCTRIYISVIYFQLTSNEMNYLECCINNDREKRYSRVISKLLIHIKPVQERDRDVSVGSVVVFLWISAVVVCAVGSGSRRDSRWPLTSPHWSGSRDWTSKYGNIVCRYVRFLVWGNWNGRKIQVFIHFIFFFVVPKCKITMTFSFNHHMERYIRHKMHNKQNTSKPGKTRRTDQIASVLT